jgi:hypothetical protein
MKTTVVKNAAMASEKRSEPMKLLKRIGSTTYMVSVYFSKTSKETMEEKILRLIEREVRNDA